ncbi:D-alanyl-lipoteichoic acid biosynthesis protein DltB [Clostridiaceae bacterium UIB06]|uniref:Teichoic acid D-alanyltransferase n=1 Tax=Clostridium thailandense TaxID=2794346 RepID=A0A949TNK8_9CLOT|nr:D-alanyl-lipoteichoic acid biosynthesis protein DltB [Clostridium thailandense]MBV7273737.1 D-alanyl-lipoteichoic acid biosynthesis protein DltB [Clostridium thailandense]MCH5137483.1 D-alanyl-lipoteichoic acid biosynthesis protein DltB [Clostridiaceae bacterium UIB06]
MIPYSDSYFFYILLLLLLPAIILGMIGKKIKWYGIFVNFIVLFLIFGNSMQEAGYLTFFYLAELLLIKVYYLIRKKFDYKWILWIIVILSLVPLLYTKFGKMIHFRSMGFLGISYLTFKAVQMIIEIYDGLIDNVNIVDFSYFILFFPTISSGPIDRSRRFIEEINKPLNRKEYIENLGEGLWKIFEGLGYKFLIAYYINSHWLSKIPLKHHTLKLGLKYMYAYSFYLFFDFAGYSLIAIGVSYILGVKTPENFNMPFISKDIKEFWNRWHMSLSFWFRDFIYTRFVMTSLKNKWFKSKYTASYIGYMITMVMMGLWHGTQSFYIVYGLYHGGLIILTDYFQRQRFYKRIKNNLYWKIASIVVTFNLTCFGFLIFSGYLFK